MSQSFIDKISPAAQKVQEQHGIVASLTIAQAILESGWGSSTLAKEANNLFGIKGIGPAGSYSVPSREFRNGRYVTEVSEFRKYNSWAECIEDRSAFLLRERYAVVIGEMDYRKACEEVAKSGYATDPQYPQKLIKLIERESLHKYDKAGDWKMKIVIGAGHGPNTPGKRTPDDSMREYHFNSAVATYVKEELANYENVQVMFPHENSRDVPISERTRKANSWGADVYVDIHANAYGNGWNSAEGIETFVHTSKAPEAMSLAAYVQNRLVRATGRNNRGVKSANFQVLRETNMTAILVECGFMTNKDEADLLKSDSYRRKCAKAIVEGIVDQYKLKLKRSSKVNDARKDDEKLDLKDWQWRMLAENLKRMNDEGILTDDKWYKKAEKKDLTQSELNWLNNVIVTRRM